MISLLTGFLLVRALSSGPRKLCRHDLFRLLLGTGLGVGICSCCVFLGLLFGIPPTLLELLLLTGTGTAAALRRSRAKCPFCETPVTSGGHGFLNAGLLVAFVALLIFDAQAFTEAAAASPHGTWDAWAIWNLRARFLYRDGGIAWRDGFTPLLDWSHPDYPLLVPAFVAGVWKTLGHEIQTVPIALGAFFTFGSAVLMAASLWILRGARQCLLAGLTLAATPALYGMGSTQCADVPLAFFVLATLATAAIADLYRSAGLTALAGMMAALAGWTKNEGLLWFVCFVLAQLAVRRLRTLPRFLAGSAPFVATILMFKTQAAASSYIFGAAGRIGMMDRLLDISRYDFIARQALLHVWNFGRLVVSPFVILAILLAVVGIRPAGRDQRTIQTAILALGLTASGYLMIYVLCPLDLAWIIGSSMDRLILQLWPGIVFTVFLAARAGATPGVPEGTLTDAPYFARFASSVW